MPFEPLPLLVLGLLVAPDGSTPFEPAPTPLPEVLFVTALPPPVPDDFAVVAYGAGCTFE